MEFRNKTAEELHLQARAYLEAKYLVHGFSEKDASALHAGLRRQKVDRDEPVPTSKFVALEDLTRKAFSDWYADIWDEYVFNLGTHSIRERMSALIPELLGEAKLYDSYSKFLPEQVTLLRQSEDQQDLIRHPPEVSFEEQDEKSEARWSAFADIKNRARARPPYYAQGSAADVYVFSSPQGEKLVAKVFNPGTTMKGPGTNVELIEQAIAGRRFRGTDNVAQYIATSMRDRISIWLFSEGKSLLQAPKIQSEHLIKFIDTVREVISKGGHIDNHPSNFLYNSEKGIILIDYHVVSDEAAQNEDYILHEKLNAFEVIADYLRIQQGPNFPSSTDFQQFCRMLDESEEGLSQKFQDYLRKHQFYKKYF